MDLWLLDGVFPIPLKTMVYLVLSYTGRTNVKKDVQRYMSNDFWSQEQQQQNGHRPGSYHDNQRAGSLLRDYRQHMRQQQSPAEFQQYSPSPLPAVEEGWPSPLSPTQGPPPYSPIPEEGRASPDYQQAWPAAQSWVSPKPSVQHWVSNTMQKVRRWSGRMAAVPRVEQEPLVLYHPSTPATATKYKPWKRSRTLRIAMMMKHRRQRWQQVHLNGAKIWSRVLIACLLFLVVLSSASTAYAYSYYQSQLPRLQSLANQQVEQTTRIYDRHGQLLYEVYDNQSGGGRRTPVSYQYIPQVMQDAMIAAEDHTFWTNAGIDPQGIVRAAIEYLQHHAVQSGGSTITQQLIKNLTGDTQISLTRKIPEAALAIGLTQEYPKWKILEMYFNISPFGAQDLGIEAAVEDYFHLSQQCDSNFNCIPAVYYLNCDSAHQSQCDPAHCATSKYCDPLLGLARASLLAGIPQNPPTYDPTLGIVDQSTGQKYYLERQQYVLQQMLSLGMQVQGVGPLTQDMVNQVEAMTARMAFTPYGHQYYHGDQHFVNWVISQLEQQLGVETFLTGGFNIYTTIDTNLEHYVEAAVYRHLDLPEQQYFGGGDGPLNTVNNVNDAAVVVEDAKTGEILAMDGSANWNDSSRAVSGNINMAIQPRQPGSTIKPIVYTAAFEAGWYPGMVIPDQKTYFPMQDSPLPATCNTSAYCPVDYGGGYTNTTIPIRNALANSRNIPAIRASLYAGLNNVIDTAQRFGITTLSQQQDANDSFALGTSAIPLTQLVGAYQVFADNGVRVLPHYVLDIWDNYGHHLYHFDPNNPGGTQVISPQLAFLMTSMLSDENARKAEFWPDHDLSFWSPPGWGAQPDPGYPDVAAKTGTTDNFKDNLTIGYTTSVVVGVWAGNADDTPMQNVIGITGAAPIWHSVMTYISGMCNEQYDQVPCGNPDMTFKPQTFTPPPGVVQQCVSATNGLEGNGSCDWMLDGEQPQQAGFSSTSSNPPPDK